MRIFAQKQLQKAVASSLVWSNPAILEPNQHRNPLLDLRRTMEHQAEPWSLQASSEEDKAGLKTKAAPLLGHDFSRVPIDPPSGAPKNAAVAGSFGPDFRSGFRMLASPLSATSSPSTAVIRPKLKVGELREKNAVSKTMNALIQRKPGEAKESTHQMPREGEARKAELEFRGTISFNPTTSGSSSTGPSEEGFTVLQIKWVVWNTGWESAPEHVDRLTIYNANRCSGCRDEKDEILSARVKAPATTPITQPDEDNFRYESITPMFGMTMPAGHYDAYVDLDVDDEVEEINEDNNTIFTSFFVKPRDKSEPDPEGEEGTTDSR